ncbi:hypothetical protein [Yeosuana sp.]|uniref:hypothetical protein n=1 Tax=Yeosuana sp. TaxID=2529388 RepID=UPI004054C714|tara:strand:+ start:441 stop:635 length:195 start_codon:yes stop_codon:yes gene_type:complete
MKIVKFFQYAYLIFAALFLYDAINKYITNGTIAYISILFSALAVFMYFFRQRFNKRYDNKDNSK